MRGFPTGGNISRLAGKGFFGPSGLRFVTTQFLVGGTFTKPAGLKFLQIIAVGPGSGGSSGSYSAAGGGINSSPAGAGGGYCTYTPNVALVPASVAVVIGTGGAGGAAVIVSSLSINSGTTGPINLGAAGSGPTTVGGGVITCNAGGLLSGFNTVGGTASCTGAWGGTFTTQTGGRGAGSTISGIGGPDPPSIAQLQVFTSSNIGIIAPAGESPSLAPGGGGGTGQFVHAPSNASANAPGYGGNPGNAAGGVGLGNVLGIGWIFDSSNPPNGLANTAANGPNGGFLQGGGAGASIISVYSGSNPANQAQVTGSGGNGGLGGGGGTGGIYNWWNSFVPNPTTFTINCGAGGNGGNGVVFFIQGF